MAAERAMRKLNDRFPIGMQVLVVDNDQICLVHLKTLLCRCKYHVTMIREAITALELLRENKKKFDLVITNVNMPDMDGFKLIEIVRLEMDLPVLMLLSSNVDTNKLVEKGITHGACGFLAKPVKIEMLQTIWNYVVRRKFATNNNLGGHHIDFGEASEMGNIALNKNPKDQNEDDQDEECIVENYQDPPIQKKPRVVWSREMHEKFVGAVNQLGGIDTAVPKKILELMKEENLTRENVASHLQKYRLSLKRKSCESNQQANSRMGSLNWRMNYQPYTATIRSFLPSGWLGRSSGGLPNSAGIIHQLGYLENWGKITRNDQGKLQSSVVIPGNHNASTIQGMKEMSSEFDELENGKFVPQIAQLPKNDDDSLFGFSNSSLILEGSYPQANLNPSNLSGNTLSNFTSNELMQIIRGAPYLQERNADIQMMLAAEVHLGTNNCDLEMERYVSKLRDDGIYIINLWKTWDMLQQAARVIVCNEDPQDIIVQYARPYAQRAVLKFTQYTGARAIAGTFSNHQIQTSFSQPHLLILTDPITDHQPMMNETALGNIPTIAFCDTDSPMTNVGIGIPANNKGKHSIGCLLWLLARMVLQMRGTIAPGQNWDVMVDQFLYHEEEGGGIGMGLAGDQWTGDVVQLQPPIAGVRAVNNWTDEVPVIAGDDGWDTAIPPPQMEIPAGAGLDLGAPSATGWN